MEGVFSGATGYDRSLSAWDVADVTTMKNMFAGATSFDRFLNSWNVSSVLNMEGMFSRTTSFDQDISDWDVGAVTNMINMFDGVTLSTVNYDLLLGGWSERDVGSNVIFDAGGSKYCNQSAHDILTNTPNTWTITDGGTDVHEGSELSCTIPAPTLLSIMSDTEDGVYGTNALVSIIATFDAELGANSTLTVTLDTGAIVNLTAIDGMLLRGSYIVAPLEASPDLTVASIAGTVYNMLTNEFTVETLPEAPNNLGDTSALVIDAIAPVITVNPRETSDNTPSLTGNVGATDAVVEITIAGQTHTATNQGDGTWRLSGTLIDPTLPDGQYDVVARVTDTLGNTATDTTTNELTIDGTAPSVLAIVDLTAATDTGVSSTDNITSDTTPDFQGMCEEDTLIQLIIDSVPRESFATCTNGTYLITAPTLDDSIHTISAVAADDIGNASPASVHLSVTIDT
jgi:hypothetical protein